MKTLRPEGLRHSGTLSIPSDREPSSNLPGEAPGQAGREFLSLGDVASAVLRSWVLVGAIVILSVIAAVAYLLLAQPKYDAVMVIAQPPDSLSGPTLGSGQSIAKDLGLFSQSTNDSYARFQAGLTSTPLAQALTGDERLLRLMFTKRWSDETGTWKPRGPIGNALYSLIGITRQAAPTDADILDYLNTHVTLTSINDNQMFEVHLSGDDPAAARELLVRITAIVDGLVRAAFLERAEAQSAYLARALRESTLSEQRQVLIQMLFNEEQKKMLGKVDLPFSIDIVSPPWVGDIPYAPKIAMTLVLAVVLGLMLAITIVIFRQRGRRSS
jgi:capsular polysaccharide biosynthesis protein